MEVRPATQHRKASLPLLFASPGSRRNKNTFLCWKGRIFLCKLFVSLTCAVKVFWCASLRAEQDSYFFPEHNLSLSIRITVIHHGCNDALYRHKDGKNDRRVDLKHIMTWVVLESSAFWNMEVSELNEIESSAQRPVSLHSLVGFQGSRPTL